MRRLGRGWFWGICYGQWWTLMTVASSLLWGHGLPGVGDIVVMAVPRELTDPGDPPGKYTTTAIEMYRIENGKLGAPIKGAMLIGNGPTDLHRISMVGNDLALDPGGSSLYVVDAGSDTVSGFAMSGGALTELPAGATPTGIVVDCQNER